MYDIIVIGGGAAGFYAAIHAAEANTALKIAIIERGKQVLTKVKVSGGGRCNVTHGEFDPSELIKSYPRGEKELLGPFFNYASGDTVAFFEAKGIPLKTEEDGRMFPTSNSSQTIIDCFLGEAENLGITVLKNSTVKLIIPPKTKENLEDTWDVHTIRGVYKSKKVLVATGSNPKVWKLLENLGHTITQPVPSLFTFNIKDDRIRNIQGVSTLAAVTVVPNDSYDSKVSIALKSKHKDIRELSAEGPLLITHWGMSGPAILKLSAWGARILNSFGYAFKIRVNWLPQYHEEAVLAMLMEIKETEPKKTIIRTKAFPLPRRLWINLVKASQIEDTTTWADISKVQLQKLSDQLTHATFHVNGKSTFKEEFVTAGGVHLKEINFKSFESKIHPGLYFAGEVMNIDAITGGFNFQNAWTSGFLAAKGMTK